MHDISNGFLKIYIEKIENVVEDEQVAMTENAIKKEDNRIIFFKLTSLFLSLKINKKFLI